MYLTLNEVELVKKLEKLIEMPSENEWLEFKEAKNKKSTEEIARYFSALSNEANLKGEEFGWLIFGITDKWPRETVGSNYRNNPDSLMRLKQEIAEQTNGYTFTEIYELTYSGKRVIMFQIPAASRGIPIPCKGYYYGRNGESLVPLSLDKIEKIRSQYIKHDWSAGICSDATIADLDCNAITRAKLGFKVKYPKLENDVDMWDDITFLNKAKITINGKITRTALILLGKDESAHLLSPSFIQMTWVLRDDNGAYKDYEHFGPPFLLNTDKLFDKIRNLKIRHIPNGTLFPIELPQYDNDVIREALHNCIAHQDYELCRRINVVEKLDELLFTNAGDFLPNSVDNVIIRDAPFDIYRNPFLSQAMFNLGMIDTIGSGIIKMFETQKKRYFPLPDYDLLEPKTVKVTIFGKILDVNYTNVLIENTGLDLTDVVLLDQIQKGKPISPEAAKKLRDLELIEGRFPNLYVSAKVAEATGSKASYIKTKGLDEKYYKELIISFIYEFGKASRQEINDLLFDKLPEIMHDERKKRKIDNLIQGLKNENRILNSGSRRMPIWILKTSNKEGC